MATGTTPTPILNMVGETVALGPYAREHMALHARWSNDFAVALYAGDYLKPRPLALFESGFEKAGKESQPHQQEFTIYERATLRPIGFTKWRDINAANRTAIYVIVIGEKDCWGKGYGTETTRLMLEYAFTVLNLHSVLLTTNAFNERAMRAYLRAGFREVGRWRESHRFGDRLYDEVVMDCLASEFTGQTGRILALP
jgi:RimJ/RimL family protein N-acetyltransferase